MSQFFNPFEGANKGGGGGGGTSDYNELSNKPKINSVPLTGNKSLEDLGIVNTVVDSELSTTSENPVQNKIVTSAINEKLDIDDAVGKNVTGTEYTIDGKIVVAQDGAEIFNDYENNKAVGRYSHSEGTRTSATGNQSHAEGTGTIASGNNSHVEGQYNTASGDNAHAEGGGGVDASGSASHAEGQGTDAIGSASHAEGSGAQATGDSSHAEGLGTEAIGRGSHSEGWGTVASSNYQHVQGKYNIEDANDKYAFIIGNGTYNNRSNAFAVDWDGKIYVNNSENGIDLNQLINDEDITGIPPLTVTLQKQQVVTQWEIEGNTEQNGTPSVSNPIPIYGVGDKTNNLCSELIDNVRINIYSGAEEYANDMKATGFIPVDFVTNQYYTPSFVVPTGTTNDTYISGYDENKEYLGRTTGGITSGQPMEFQGSVDTSAVKYVRICANMQTQDVMFNVGNTALPYEPYGYKIPIVVNENTIIPFYLDSPLYEGDFASFADNGSSFITRANGVIESYNGETIGNDYVSSTGELSTGAFVVYKLDHLVTTQITLPDFQLRSGINTIDVDTDVTPANLYVRWGASNIKTLQFAYISPDGDDVNEGSSANSPLATINHALDLGCSRIFLAGGKYAQTIDLSKAKGKHIQIESLTRDSRPVFVDPDCVLVESATLENGVYHATIDVSISSGNAWIYQDDVPDLETTISDNERMPLQRGKSERCEDTKIEKCSSDNLQDALSEIASAPTNVYKWYLDGTTLYFSAPNAPSAQNPICYSPGNGLFSNGDRSISLTINGIKCKYISLNVEDLCDVSLTDCQVSNIFGWGAISYSNTLNAKFLRCEASRCYNNGNGDGFNADVTNSGEAFAKHYSATLIDCWSHDNCDDGYSNHRHAESTIIGGLFEYNGKAGLTPSYGEHCSCYNVYSRKNYAGFMCAGEAEQAEGGKYTQLICHSCIAESNDRGGYYAGFVVKDNGNRMVLIDCKSINNRNAYYMGETATAQLIDCTAIGSQTLLDGHPENATVETTVVGRKVEGTTYTIDDEQVVAKAGAEVFNTGKAEEGGQIIENDNKAIGYFSHAEGFMTQALGEISHTEGRNTKATNNSAHAEGSSTTASGNKSHAEGEETVASGRVAHAEGSETIASGSYSHAEGTDTTASGFSSHAEGGSNVASGHSSHAEGYFTTASGTYSHAEGWWTIAAGDYQHVQGKCNVAQGDLNTEMAFIIGNGTSDQNRSNAFAVDWNGKIYQGNTNNGVNLADQQKEIDYAINTGAKNKLIITNQNNTLTVNGITFTKNADQTITATGTATANADYPLNAAQPLELGQSYILSGCPNGGGVDNFLLRQQSGAIDYGNGVTFTAESSSGNFYIRIRNGYAIQGSITFKPMLRYEEITDNTFEPYAKTNRELTIAEDEDRVALIKQVDEGAKNKFSGTYTSQTLNGVVFTVNADGTITANRASSSSSSANMPSTTFTLKAGTYVFSCSPNPERDVTYDSYIYSIDNSATIARDNPNDPPRNIFTLARDTTVRVNIRVASGYEASNLIFSPMICTKAEWDISQAVVPYAPTNRELYETKVSQKEALTAKATLEDAIDLDTIKTAGIYNGVNSAGWNAVHMPVANGGFSFSLMVIESGEFIIQIFKQLNGAGDPDIYIRRFYIWNTGWDSWYKFTGVPV